PRSYVLDLGFSRTALGRDLSGLVGSDLFRRYVVSIDYDRRRVALYEPDTFDAAGLGENVPLVLEKDLARVRVRLKAPGREPVERLLLLDTGSGDAVDDALVSELPGRILVAGGVGVGGAHSVSLGRYEWAQIGPFVMRHPTGVSGGPPLVGGSVLR